MTEGLLADASARVRTAAPESTPETVEQLVRDYLEAAEPEDRAAFTAADVAGYLRRAAPGGARLVMMVR